MQKTCEVCGVSYEARGPNQKRCDGCRGVKDVGVTDTQPVSGEALAISGLVLAKHLDEFEVRLSELERFIADNFSVDWSRWKKGLGLPERVGKQKR